MVDRGSFKVLLSDAHPSKPVFLQWSSVSEPPGALIKMQMSCPQTIKSQSQEKRPRNPKVTSTPVWLPKIAPLCSGPGQGGDRMGSLI